MPEMDGFEFAEQFKNERSPENVSIIMLTSAGHLGDAARCRELGISAYLVKPVRQREVLDAICGALGTKPPERPILVTAPCAARRTKPGAGAVGRGQRRKSDAGDPVTRKAGICGVTVAGDGREALAALEKDNFDVVLMDIQMPEMDGFEATAAIRTEEKYSGRHIPIIAMTANALKGDQERCLEAGMDGYIAKPIRTKELFAAIETILDRNGATQALESAPKLLQ